MTLTRGEAHELVNHFVRELEATADRDGVTFHVRLPTPTFMGDLIALARLGALQLSERREEAPPTITQQLQASAVQATEVMRRLADISQQLHDDLTSGEFKRRVRATREIV